MNFAEMQRQVFSLLRDENKMYVTDEDVEAWINQAQRDLAARTELGQTEDTGTVGGDGVVAVPADALKIIHLRLGDDDVQPMDDTEFWTHSDDGGYVSPSIARVFAGNVEIYPTPASTQEYTMRYVYAPEDLSESTDTSPLPVELQDRMVYYAVARGMYKQFEFDAGDRYMQLYERGLPASTLGKGLLNPGPMNILYEPSPWDVEGQHRG